MTDSSLSVALVHEVFEDSDGPGRLEERLVEANDAGAWLALLPELPLNRWSPARRTPLDADAEEPEGPRHRAMADAARSAGIGLLGGVIVRDPDAGRRFSRALLFDASGRLLSTYDKLHLPSEEGFWESDHYEPGNRLPRPVGGFPLSLGIQICSDLNRPEGCHLLGARGVEVILAPRATPAASYERWRTVIRANAVTSGAYVVSVNRTPADRISAIGGPSLVVAPDGEVLLETTERLSTIRLERAAVERARLEYPGYLPVRSALYARGWSEIAGDAGA